MPEKPLKEGVDFYWDPQGRMVLTAHFLHERGYCCGSGCRHCPYSEAEYRAARERRQRGRLGFLS